METPSDIDEQIEWATACYGFDPRIIGVRHRGFWEVPEIEDDEERTGAQIGDLCVKTRDPGGGSFDTEAQQRPTYRGMAIDSWDTMYCYYYFRPLEEASQ